MSDSTAVGFAFQGDVFSGASMTYSALGHILKSLSDGGVDIFALSACVQLGGTIPITMLQQSTVRKMISSRTGKSSYLAKALQLGWGHSDVAVELSRTRQGSAALMLVGVLATGGTYFEAGEALQELCILSHCADTMVPNVDVFTGMVRYLAPFMQDMSFQHVLAQVTAAVTSHLSKKGRYSQWEQQAANGKGSPKDWTKSITQLAYSAQRNEHVRIITDQRGSWIAATASFLFGMAVTVEYAGETAWEAAGCNGAATIQLSGSSSTAVVPGASLNLQIITSGSHAPPTTPLLIAYPLAQVLGVALKSDARITPEIRAIVQEIICYHCWHISSAQSKVPDRQFLTPTSQALTAVLADMGVPEIIIRASHRKHHAPIADTTTMLPFGEFISITEHESDIIALACGELEHGCDIMESDQVCLCRSLGRLVEATTILILALCFCSYEIETLCVNLDAIQKPIVCTWTQRCASLSVDHAKAPDQLSEAARPSAITNVLQYLGQILLGDDDKNEIIKPISTDSSSPLALSGSNITIYHKFLFDTECFDIEHRFLRIANGRISLGGVLRSTVLAYDPGPDVRAVTGATYYCLARMNREYDIYRSWRVAPGLDIRPSYSQGVFEIRMNLRLTKKIIHAELVFTLQGKVNNPFDGNAFDALGVNYFDGLYNLSRCRFRTQPCGHDPDSPLQSDTPSTYSISPLLGGDPDDIDPPRFRLYALKDHTLESLIQAQFLNPDKTHLTMGTCLACTVRSEKQHAPIHLSNVNEVNKSELTAWQPKEISIIMI